MLTTEDRLDILDLLGRYNYAIDDCNGDAWAACFTEDRVFSSPNGTVTGHEALRKFADEYPSGTLHYTSNHVITGDGDHAQMRCYLQFVSAPPDKKPAVRFCGRYEDVLVKTADGWRFKSRAIGPAL